MKKLLAALLLIISTQAISFPWKGTLNVAAGSVLLKTPIQKLIDYVRWIEVHPHVSYAHDPCSGTYSKISEHVWCRERFKTTTALALSLVAMPVSWYLSRKIVEKLDQPIQEGINCYPEKTRKVMSYLKEAILFAAPLVAAYYGTKIVSLTIDPAHSWLRGWGWLPYWSSAYVDLPLTNVDWGYRMLCQSSPSLKPGI